MDLNELIDNYNKTQTEYQEKFRNSFCSTIVDIIKTNDKIEHISWNQYAPWFNDGDTCEFRVDSWSLCINDEYRIDEHDDENDINNFNDIFSKTEYILDTTPDEMMKHMFGNHVKVTINSNGDVCINEYDNHD